MSRSLIAIAFLLIVHGGVAQSNQEPTSMRLSQDHLIIEEHGDETSLQFDCRARVGSCSFSYQILPRDWSSEGNKLVFPTFYLSSIRSFLVRANISEPTGDSMVRDIVIDFTKGGSMYSSLLNSRVGADAIDSSDFDQPISSKDPQVVPIVNEFGQTYLEAEGIIPSLPSIPKLDAVIVSSDPYQISSTLQNILSFKQSCSQKSSYLEEAIARIRQHIDFNKELLAAEQKNHLMSQDGLKSLEKERDSIKEELNLLKDKDKIKKELSRLEGEKQTSFNKYYSYEIIAVRYQDKMKELAISEIVDPEELDSLKAQVEKDRIQIQNLDQKIKKLEETKTVLEKKLKENEKKILDTMNSAEGSTDQKKISQLQNTYKQYMSLADKYKTQYENTESQLEVLNQKLATLENSLERLTTRLETVEDTISDIKNSTPEELQNIKVRLEVLERNLPKIQEQAENCKIQTGSTRQIKTESKYEPPSEEIKPEKPKPSYDIVDLRNKNKNSNAVNLFSSKWIMSYGVPKTYSFTCSSSDSLVNNHGKILQVDSAAIAVEDPSGGHYILHIGTCTRITGPSSSFAPKINDIVDWNGYVSSQGIYNALRINFYAVN